MVSDSQFMQRMKESVWTQKIRIGFNEVTDERVLKAAEFLSHEHLVVPILIGDTSTIEKNLKAFNINLPEVHIYDPAKYLGKAEYAKQLYELRKKKGMTHAQAKEKVETLPYFSTLLLSTDEIDGLVSGAVNTTANVLLPALEIIGTAAHTTVASSFFIMRRDDEYLFFSDCGVNIDPDAHTLADIAIQSYDSCVLFGFKKPKVAILSFSTKGSATYAGSEKIRQAVSMVQQKRPEISIDGELQFDTAYVPKTAQRKAPLSPIKGDATVFIFPDLEAGNIAYKIAEHLGGYQALGPIVQGLAKQVTDLSRGCSTNDIICASIMTAYMAKHKKN